MKITFLGGVNTVTGSKFLVEYSDKKILIDCGLFQGLKQLRLKNWEHFPVRPSDIDCILLTHAHIDHSGYIPLLVNEGFKGKVFCSSGTHQLAKILLSDSGHLQEEDARRANEEGFSKHKKALPLYTQKDALNALKYFQSVDYFR
ncbi:MAG: MBL fold metallo-hydrolase, partial [Bacteriovoracaceae bacterium]